MPKNTPISLDSFAEELQKIAFTLPASVGQLVNKVDPHLLGAGGGAMVGAAGGAAMDEENRLRGAAGGLIGGAALGAGGVAGVRAVRSGAKAPAAAAADAAGAAASSPAAARLQEAVGGAPAPQLLDPAAEATSAAGPVATGPKPRIRATATATPVEEVMPANPQALALDAEAPAMSPAAQRLADSVDEYSPIVQGGAPGGVSPLAESSSGFKPHLGRPQTMAPTADAPVLQPAARPMLTPDAEGAMSPAASRLSAAVDDGSDVIQPAAAGPALHPGAEMGGLPPSAPAQRLQQAAGGAVSTPPQGRPSFWSKVRHALMGQ